MGEGQCCNVEQHWSSPRAVLCQHLAGSGQLNTSNPPLVTARTKQVEEGLHGLHQAVAMGVHAAQLAAVVMLQRAEVDPANTRGKGVAGGMVVSLPAATTVGWHCQMQSRHATASPVPTQRRWCPQRPASCCPACATHPPRRRCRRRRPACRTGGWPSPPSGVRSCPVRPARG